MHKKNFSLQILSDGDNSKRSASQYFQHLFHGKIFYLGSNNSTRYFVQKNFHRFKI